MTRSPCNALWRGLAGALPVIPSITVAEWASKHRIMSRESSYRAGRFQPFPMQVAPMEDVNDPAVSEIVLCWAAQTAGKTEILFNVMGYFMQADPSSILYVQPTDKLAAEYSKERIAVVIRDTPVLAAIVRSPRTRDSGNTVFSKNFPGGNLAIVGANSPAGLAGRPRRVVLLDEVDRYPPSAGREGDPCALADKRAETFPNAVKMKTSTPTIEGSSRISSLLEQSDLQKWHARCPRCDHEQVFMWSQVGWNPENIEEAWIRCANDACGAKLNDQERIAAVKAGRWKATRPFRGIRGFWLNGLNRLTSHHKGFRDGLHEMVADFIKAKAGGTLTLRVWTNTFLAETWKDPTEATIQPDKVAERCESYFPDQLPDDVLIVTAGVDVQKNRVELELAAYGADEEKWGIEKVVIWGNTLKDEEVWQKLDAQLLRTFKRLDGAELKVERAFIDMNYLPDRVLGFCRPRITRGVFPCIGINKVGNLIPPLLPKKPSANNKAGIPHWPVGVTAAKTMIYDRLLLPIVAKTANPRAMHFPVGFGYDHDHFKQLTSEVRKIRYTHGQAYSIFEKPNDSVRNEALDLAVYGLAALQSLFPINWAKLAENRAQSKPKEEVAAVAGEPAVTSVTTPAPVPIRRQSWATRW